MGKKIRGLASYDTDFQCSKLGLSCHLLKERNQYRYKFPRRFQTDKRIKSLE